MEYFITEIDIKKVRHLENLTIKLSDTERKHLILTGKNGSGKTSVLEQLRITLSQLNGEATRITSQGSYKIPESERLKSGFVNVLLSNTSNLYLKVKEGEMLLVHFYATQNRVNKPEIPKSSIKLDLNAIHKGIGSITGISIVQYLVNLRFDKLNALDENDTETAKKIDDWFINFTKILQSIFQDTELQLKFDISEKNYYILTKGREKFDFTTLSDGYSAFLNIVTEIILRMESKAPKVYDIQGIVLIDEIETHLHIDLQEKILPLLTTFFPKIQFIVTTHSPFVLSSISNTVIYDLENHSYLTDVSDLSYSALIKYHFKITDEYSILIKHKIANYQSLIEKKERTETENKQLFDLDTELSNLSPVLSPELYLQFTQLQEQLA